jgi:quercetin dioxygenase-like cupin family protein
MVLERRARNDTRVACSRGDRFMKITIRVTTVLAIALSQSLTLGVSSQVPGPCETPVSARTSGIGCYVAAIEKLGVLADSPVFWHLYVFPSRSAAEAIKPAHGTVIVAFEQTWLFVIAGADWRPASGERIARVGPLPHEAGRSYTARYLESTIPPGQRTPVHIHAGPEAWHLLAGAECLETPDGIAVIRAGESAIVREGPPMMLSSVGTETRHGFTLVLHDASKPWTMVTSDWTPKGLCPK